jgi:hypothetical protein
MTEEELNDWIEQLVIERDDILERISSLRRELTDRKEKSEEEYSIKLPESVFDLNKEQFDWVFEYGHHTTKKRYEISRKYLNQLKGVYSDGFLIKTNQYKFQISTSDSFNYTEDGFELKPEIVKSIKFLGDNLKRTDGYVLFGIGYYYSDDDYNHKVKYYSDDNLEFGIGGYFKKMNSIEDLLKDRVESDIESKNNDNDW